MRSEDPELKPIFDEIRSGGMAAMMKVGRSRQGYRKGGCCWAVRSRGLRGPVSRQGMLRLGSAGDANFGCCAQLLQPPTRSLPLLPQYMNDPTFLSVSSLLQAIREHRHGKDRGHAAWPARMVWFGGQACRASARTLHTEPLELL